MLFSISGSVERPGVYEGEFGVNLWDFIESSTGGVRGGRALKGVIPGGSSSTILTADEARNTTLDYEALAAAGSMLGSGAIMVVSEAMRMARPVWRSTTIIPRSPSSRSR